MPRRGWEKVVPPKVDGSGDGGGEEAAVDRGGARQGRRTVRATNRGDLLDGPTMRMKTIAIVI